MRKAIAELDIPIDEQPNVAELTTKLAEAQAELNAAEAELNHLTAILNPLPASSTHTPNVSELEALRARQQEPFAHERYVLAKTAVLELRPRVEAARIEALRHVTDVRTRARVPLLKRFSMALDEAARIGEELAVFDQETVQLGGSNPGHPFAQLLDEPPYRQGDATRVRQLVDTLEQN
ncbi:MAG: hypothetical protein IPP12_18780 [Nitrospira sp.]|nr:hypothetical protein [Nitrospira sp.]